MNFHLFHNGYAICSILCYSASILITIFPCDPVQAFNTTYFVVSWKDHCETVWYFFKEDPFELMIKKVDVEFRAHEWLFLGGTATEVSADPHYTNTTMCPTISFYAVHHGDVIHFTERSMH